MTLKTPGDELGGLFVADISALSGLDVVRYNLAPTDPVVVLRLERDPSAGLGRALSSMRWGLVPPWARDPSAGAKMLNARLETVDEKPAYREPLRQRRCAVLADGFYEWQTLGRRKQPWWFHRRDGRPFAVAGLWSQWQPPEPGAAPLVTCTIVTREASGAIAAIHDRMPGVLDEAHLDAWLDGAEHDAARLKRLLFEHAAEVGNDDVFTAHPVSPRVNHVRADGPECIEPVTPEEEDDGGQGSLFE